MNDAIHQWGPGPRSAPDALVRPYNKARHPKSRGQQTSPTQLHSQRLAERPNGPEPQLSLTYGAKWTPSRPSRRPPLYSGSRELQ